MVAIVVKPMLGVLTVNRGRTIVKNGKQRQGT